MPDSPKTPAYKDPESDGYGVKYLCDNKPCLGCGKKPSGCVWGQWCYNCNVERMDRVDAGFAKLKERFDAR